MKLYIAEKPSLGRAIAQALPKPHKNNQGYISVGNGDCVTWCVGHLLEQAEPDNYDPKYKKWNINDLPIIPEEWQLKPKSKTKSQLSVIKKLIKQADRLVNAGDPDREGQLLVDEVINYLKTPKAKQQHTERLLINDLNVSAVKKALTNMKSNREFIALSTSALARSRADWLYGMNMTRAFTIQGQKVGYSGVLSVGRVQTPVLGLVVRRDESINNFISKPFYEVLAHLKPLDSNMPFTAKWQPSEACQAYMDEEGRISLKNLAENVVRRISDKPAIVTNILKQHKKQAPPLPYSLSSLQIDANKIFGISAKQCLDYCQSLYEKHKLITYPRSDSRHLPQEQFYQAEHVISAVANNDSRKLQACADADPTIKSKAWNDNKVDAHHAIIPSSAKRDITALSQPERNIYHLICQQYLLQFYPSYEYAETKVEIEIEKGLFKTSARQTLNLGWKVIQTNQQKTNKDKSNAEQELPPLNKGQALHCQKGELIEKHTQPPKPYTDATLLSAMTGISRYVNDPEIKKILKETDGLGTEATRAGILELLIKRDFIKRQAKNLHSTDAGQALIKSLPTQASYPDMTALWESSLDKISHKELAYHNFIEPLTENIKTLVQQASENLPENLRGIKSSKPAYKKKWTKKKRSSTKAA